MASNIRKCKICGELARMEGSVCSECEEKLREEFKVVREFILTHPGASAATIAGEMDVEETHVLFMIENKWLTSEEPPTGNEPRCKMCGRPLSPLEVAGRMCRDCMLLTQQKLDSVRKSIVQANPDRDRAQQAQKKQREQDDEANRRRMVSRDRFNRDE